MPKMGPTFLIMYYAEVEKCVQELHLLAQSAKTVTTIQRRIRRHIQTEWKQRNIVDSARHTHYTKKQNNAVAWEVMYERE